MLRNKKLFALIGVFIILLVLPIIIFIQQQQTQTQSNADEISPLSCTTTPSDADVMLIVDVSGSTTNNRESQKEALRAFAQQVSSQSNQYNVGLITYASQPVLNWSLQNGTDYAGLINAIDTMPFIDNASAGEDDAIALASQEFQLYGRNGVRKNIVLLTDRWDSQAQSAADADVIANNTSYFIIAYDLSNSTIRRMLQDQAVNTGGTFQEFDPSQASQSEIDVLLQSANDVICPSVTPILTLSPSPISSPTPTLFPGTITPTSTPSPTEISCAPIITTAQNSTTGECRDFPNACLPSGWVAQQCSVTTSITPTTIPTSTPSSSDSLVHFTAFLHGLGSAGDNKNPTNSTFSNKNPLHNNRLVTVEAINDQGQVVATGVGDVTYNSVTGGFKGSANFGTSLPNGTYAFRVKTNQYLKQNFPGFFQILNGQALPLPNITLITGDIQNDNALNILDYNVLLGCYSDLAPAINCTPQQKLQADLNDDGEVNQFDYNLFLRELSVQSGD